MVKLEMEVEGYPDWQTDMDNPDFVKVAEAMNIRAWEAKKSDDVSQVIQEAFDHKGPALVNIYTDPAALAMPPEIKFEQMKGFAKSMSKLMLNGRTAEVIDDAKSNFKYLKELF